MNTDVSHLSPSVFIRGFSLFSARLGEFCPYFAASLGGLGAQKAGSLAMTAALG